MFDFNYNENFEPSPNTKAFWLYTRKREMTAFGVTRPGLFATVNFEWQVVGFFAIFLLEGIATWWAFQEGVAITAILVSIFADVVLAVLSHLPQPNITKLKNELLFVAGTNLANARSRLSSRRAVQRFFYLLIIVSACFKFYWFFAVYEVFDSTALFVLTCYLIGALLHISCTGYAIFTAIFEIKIRREHREYNSSGGASHAFNPQQPRLHRFDTAIELQPVTVGRHKIERTAPPRQTASEQKATDVTVERERTSDGFFLYTNGILTDKELTQMIGQQITPDQQRVVAVEGVKHQYNMMH